MTIVIPSLVWFAMALGLAIAFDSWYAVWLRHSPAVAPEPETVQAYWCVVCLIAFLTSANPLVLISVLPVAASHYDLTLSGDARPTIAEVLWNMPNALRRLWSRIVK